MKTTFTHQSHAISFIIISFIYCCQSSLSPFSLNFVSLLLAGLLTFHVSIKILCAVIPTSLAVYVSTLPPLQPSAHPPVIFFNVCSLSLMVGCLFPSFSDLLKLENISILLSIHLSNQSLNKQHKQPEEADGRAIYRRLLLSAGQQAQCPIYCGL